MSDDDDFNLYKAWEDYFCDIREFAEKYSCRDSKEEELLKKLFILIEAVKQMTGEMSKKSHIQNQIVKKSVNLLRGALFYGEPERVPLRAIFASGAKAQKFRHGRKDDNIYER